MVIIGGAESWKDAPLEGAWIHGNQLDRFIGKPIGKIFEIHEDLSEHPPEYPQWLVDQNIELIVSDRFPIKADHVKVFPRECNVLNMLCSTPAYMMALAIHEGHKEIEIYGVNMGIENHEYFKQRPSMYAWIGYAKGLGIDVKIAKNSSLFKETYDEGRDWGKMTDEKRYLEMANRHKQKIEELQSKISELHILINTHDGARQVYERLAKGQILSEV